MAASLDDMALSDEERGKLKALGVSTPFALLSMRRASTEAFDAHIGSARADTIAAQAETLLTDEERDRLSRPAPRLGSLGARLPRKPK
ncbi:MULTISPECIES: hypothetical protein [unclassified Caballeronia]|uniref:hypothetical protein n=1 Tax=unclassified Caballeronia TaxID=2646786 RepID=UPI002859E85A|nr:MULTISPECIES: hypothetical protein [unclassified Caballeronia]MDR5753019.1 hypothetical protein [Caballeronia sp. LZ024]MDR5845083.1 hypothetical protein [Caballeronia sp. LZ031]